MFRAACDKRVTTPPARQPTTSKPAHREMPAGKPDLHQTRPRQLSALPHHRVPAAHRTPSRHPSARPDPCGTGRVLALRQLGAPRTTPDHFIPLLYFGGVAASTPEAVDVLIEGCAYGSLSMTAYTLGLACSATSSAAYEAAQTPEFPADASNI
jgi:hypothetical protein